MDNINFNDLEFNLYELLDLNQDCTTSDVKKKFTKIVKKFHPDKISKLEEKIYYNITLAYQILSNIITKEKYDNWLNKNSYYNLKYNFQKSNSLPNENINKSSREMKNDFELASERLLKRHGIIKEDNRDFNLRIKEKQTHRSQLKNIKREHFKNTDEFNESFDYKKTNGEFSDKIIKYNNEEIIPYEESKKQSISYVKLSDFNKLYLEDTCETQQYTSLNRAFKLQPYIESKGKINIEEGISKYNKNSRNFQNLDFDFNI